MGNTSKHVTIEEQVRRASSVLRIIQEYPGKSAAGIARLLGECTAREIRTRIRLLRQRGERIVVGQRGGYYDLSMVADARKAGEFVTYHLLRTRRYLLDHAELLKQISNMSREEICERIICDLATAGTPGTDADQMVEPDDLAGLTEKQRVGWFALLVGMLRRIAAEPGNWATERAYLANEFKTVFRVLTGEDAAKLAQARKLLEEIGV